MSVVIKGTGATGTHFLWEVIKKHTDHTAYHEPPKWLPGVESNRKDLQRLLDSNEGKCVFLNGKRFDTSTLEVDHIGVILRPFREVTLSFYNRRKGEYPTVGKAEKTVRRLAELIEAGAFVVDFHRMTTDAAYLTEALKKGGMTITTPIPDATMKQKVNHNGRDYATHYADLPQGLRESCEAVCQVAEELKIPILGS